MPEIGGPTGRGKRKPGRWRECQVAPPPGLEPVGGTGQPFSGRNRKRCRHISPKRFDEDLRFGLVSSTLKTNQTKKGNYLQGRQKVMQKGKRTHFSHGSASAYSIHVVTMLWTLSIGLHEIITNLEAGGEKDLYLWNVESGRRKLNLYLLQERVNRLHLKGKKIKKYQYTKVI